jgi:hypothetical protein
MECPFQAKSAGCTAPQNRGARHLDTRADYSARPRGATRGRGSTRARSGPAGVSLRALPSLSNFGPGPRGPRRTRGRCLRDIASSPARRRSDGVTLPNRYAFAAMASPRAYTLAIPRHRGRRSRRDESQTKKDTEEKPSSASLSFRISGKVSFLFESNSSRYTRALSAAAAAMRASLAKLSAILILLSLSSASCIKYCCAFFAACAAANRSLE